MYKYYKLLQEGHVFKNKEQITRETALGLLPERKIQELEEELRQSARVAPHFSLSALQLVHEDIYLMITYFPFDLLIEQLSSLFPKSKLSTKLDIILSASHLTVVNKKVHVQLVAYIKGKKVPILTTTKRSAVPVLKKLVDLHKEYTA